MGAAGQQDSQLSSGSDGSGSSGTVACLLRLLCVRHASASASTGTVGWQLQMQVGHIALDVALTHLPRICS
jgi:hypothetical protein